MIVIDNKLEWNRIINEEFREFSDIYFKYEYFKLYQKHYSVRAEAIFWEDKNVKIFHARLVREIPYKDYENYYDLTTPYGYGGPLIINKNNNNINIIKKSIINFYKKYIHFCEKCNYTCEFIRFHPIYENHIYFKNIIPIEYINDVVVVDLVPSLEEIVKKIKKGHRYNIRKTIREGCNVTIVSNPSTRDLEDFINCYYNMLSRHAASKKYYFSINFIKDHFKLLNSILIKIIYDNLCIGSSIFIVGHRIVHYHLSGAYKIKGLYPSDLMIYEAIKWSKENGFKYLNLGGGRGRNDSLFKFKAGFSNIYKKFYIGKIIFNKKVYSDLVSITGVNNTNFFPAYRAKLNNTIV